jgi:hypothetical protein
VSTSQNGCTVTATDCTVSGGGPKCMVSTNLTYAADGSTASGTETLACTAVQMSSCTSTYSVTETRQ